MIRMFRLKVLAQRTRRPGVLGRNGGGDGSGLAAAPDFGVGDLTGRPPQRPPHWSGGGGVEWWDNACSPPLPPEGSPRPGGGHGARHDSGHDGGQDDGRERVRLGRPAADDAAAAGASSGSDAAEKSPTSSFFERLAALDANASRRPLTQQQQEILRKGGGRRPQRFGDGRGDGDGSDGGGSDDDGALALPARQLHSDPEQESRLVVSDHPAPGGHKSRRATAKHLKCS